MRPLTISESATTKQGNKKNILSEMSSIISAVKALAKERAEQGQANLDIEEILSRVSSQTEYLGNLMDLSQVQVLVLAACLERCSRHRDDLSDIAEELHINYLRLLEFNDDIMDLKKKCLIRVDMDNRVWIPAEVLRAFSEGKPFSRPEYTGLTTIGIMRRLKDLFEQLDNEVIDDNCLYAEASTLIRENPETAFSKAYFKYRIDNDYETCEKQLFLFLAHRYYNEDDDVIFRHDIESAFASQDMTDRIHQLLHNERLDLMRNGLVEFRQDGGLKSKESIHIVDSVKQEFFDDACTVVGQQDSTATTIQSGKITERELFYDADTARQVSVLESMLSENRYGSVCESLRKKGLRTGFTCLFYGSPGTGKTETVYQLARRSGRDLMMVDVSQIKSCWVGESEKNIKGAFEKYRKMVKESRVTPILLFNEADAIFGIRQEGAERAVDKMENSIQNIILQEMEDLDGILIATTNLTQNLDKAFERRFLYKLRFKKPSIEARVKIWRSMLPDLSEAEAAELARTFDFSGGQIENVSRKKMIQGVLDGQEPGFEALRNFCSEEILANTEKRTRIGF